MAKRRKRSPPAALTFEERRALLWVKIRHLIEEHGFYIQSVLGDRTHAPFTYTVGLAPDAPELILFGLDHGVAAHIIHEIVDQGKQGKAFLSGSTYKGLIDGPLPLYFMDITDEGERWREHMLIAIRWHLEHGRTNFPVYQVVWPDTQGRFPWQVRFEERFRRIQPLLFEPLPE